MRLMGERIAGTGEQLSLNFIHQAQRHQLVSIDTWRDLYEEFVRENAHLPGASILFDVPWELGVRGGSDAH